MRFVSILGILGRIPAKAGLTFLIGEARSVMAVAGDPTLSRLQSRGRVLRAGGVATCRRG